MLKKHILVVDDEKNIVELIKMNLERSGFNVTACYNGEDAIKLATTQIPDLILLDLMLPDLDGFEVFRRIRLNEKTKNISIIMVTARSEETDKVIGFGLGADDYITKPFGVRELEARIKNALRKVQPLHIQHSDIKSQTNVLHIKDIIINTEGYFVTKGEKPIDLTLTEFKILKALADKRGHVLSREELLSKICSDKENPDIRIIDVHIRNIRKKIGEDNSSTRYIETIRGVGYKID